MKKNHPDRIILMSCGDFYETYNDDAYDVSCILGIVLTKQGDVQMAGFPLHALDTYLPKLTRAGKRVAICDYPYLNNNNEMEKKNQETRERIGARIAELRKEKGMTQKELAEATGLIQPNIARIENGRYSTSLDTLARIAEALGAKLDFITD